MPLGSAGPISFSSLLWSVVLGYLVWGDVPGLNMLAGGVLIMCAAALIFGAERYRLSQADKACADARLPSP